jgi:hypothetical protein
MILASGVKRLMAASVLGVAAFSISVPAEARMGGFGGHMGGFHGMGGMGGFHHGSFAGRGFGGFHRFGGFNRGFHHRGFGFGGPFAAGLVGGAVLGGLYGGYGGYGYPYGGFYSYAGYGDECFVARRRVFSPWGYPVIRERLVCY